MKNKLHCIWRMKNRRGSAGLMMFVDKLRLPLASNWFVNTRVHWLSCACTFVLVSKAYRPLVEPLMALMVRVGPLTATLVMRKGGIDVMLNVASVETLLLKPA